MLLDTALSLQKRVIKTTSNCDKILKIYEFVNRWTSTNPNKLS